MKRMTKFITVGEKNYRVKRIGDDCYSVYHCDGFFKDEFFGYEDKCSIVAAINMGTWQ